ncbi:N-acetylmuramoyl-L-alanine amidase [Neobacillus kokaensis]|uniref:Sporulation-specific N-acetylmuramoyl-L-alanine amidase n=1 Tax=Neobacillus kokaensis TaxID=2759023 RepID=A0ABQ3NA88_9BACI|nr:N-acetylmuramoyl-L-alanine amidase [Neobacillus kokaensis]GHI00984.1 sporulation-specific N-acetylmuramoyl-L-alanine amidase [Neobacillus kokaensis]
MARLSFDAGHGGSGVTPGKRTPDNEYEWDFNNILVCSAMNYLDQYEVELLRVDDPSGKTDINLNQRVKNINRFNPDFHCSFHNNAYTGKWGSHSGTETYTHMNSSSEAKKVAAKIQDAVVNVLGTKNRGTKQADFRILECAAPACLVEFLFMDSRSDINKLRNEKLLKQTGEAVAKELAEHFKLKKKQEPKPSPIPDKLHKVQIGAFKERANAESLAKKAKSKGFDTFVVFENNLWKVQLGAFNHFDHADALAKKANKNGFEVYLS